MFLEFIRPTLHFVVHFVPINYTVKEIMWAGPGGTAIPGQPVTGGASPQQSVIFQKSV